MRDLAKQNTRDNRKFFPSPTRVCTACKKTRSGTQYNSNTTKVCNPCKGL